MEKDLVCPICGAPTFLVYGKNPRKDGLCGEHSQQLFRNEIEQCSDCGRWHKINEVCCCKKNDQLVSVNFKTCSVCGKKSNGKPQCRDCYNETRDFMETLDKNSPARKLRDYYYNLKERIFIIKSIEETKKQCNKLIAIAILENDVNDDSSLLDRVFKDVESLIKGKQQPAKPLNSSIEEEKTEQDKQKAKIHTAQDGHNLESEMEVIIDDILYTSYILHCAGKNIDEITEKRKKCDWFVPIANGKGIYIEYWGMNTDKYRAARKEKEELYIAHNIPYIGIEMDDPKRDRMTFQNNLLRELRTIAVDRYGFMPEWKK